MRHLTPFTRLQRSGHRCRSGDGMDRGVVWTSRQGCTVNGAWIGGGFWDAYQRPLGVGKIRSAAQLINVRQLTYSQPSHVALAQSDAFGFSELKFRISIRPPNVDKIRTGIKSKDHICSSSSHRLHGGSCRNLIAGVGPQLISNGALPARRRTITVIGERFHYFLIQCLQRKLGL